DARRERAEIEAQRLHWPTVTVCNPRKKGTSVETASGRGCRGRVSRWRRARAGADDPTGVGRGVRPEVSSVTTQRGCVPDQPLGNPDCAFPDRADGPLTALSAPDHVGERSFSTSFKGGSLRSPPSAGCGRSLRPPPHLPPPPPPRRLRALGILRLRRRLTGPRALGQL